MWNKTSQVKQMLVIILSFEKVFFIIQLTFVPETQQIADVFQISCQLLLLLLLLLFLFFLRPT